MGGWSSSWLGACFAVRCYISLALVSPWLCFVWCPKDGRSEVVTAPARPGTWVVDVRLPIHSSWMLGLAIHGAYLVA